MKRKKWVLIVGLITLAAVILFGVQDWRSSNRSYESQVEGIKNSEDANEILIIKNKLDLINQRFGMCKEGPIPEVEKKVSDAIELMIKYNTDKANEMLVSIERYCNPYCGDYFCDEEIGENYTNCSIDCKAEIGGKPVGEAIELNLIWLWVLILLIILVLLYIKIKMPKEKKPKGKMSKGEWRQFSSNIVAGVFGGLIAGSWFWADGLIGAEAGIIKYVLPPIISLLLLVIVILILNHFLVKK